MPDWVEVANEDEFEGAVICVDYDGIEIAIFKLEDGYYAIDDECSHAVASLSEGKIEDSCIIKCPKHGATFDIKTGENLSFPAVEPVASYPVRCEDGKIFIDVD